MKFDNIFKHKINHFYLFPIYLITSVIIISFTFVFAFSKSEKNINPPPAQQSTEAAAAAPDIKVMFGGEDIRTVNIEEYLTGVVAAEMPPSFENEALKAQAVAARTYIIHKKGTPDSAHSGADVCTNPSHCKAYISDADAFAKWGDEWNKTYKKKISGSVSSTAGIIVTYNDEPITAVFHSTSTGRTENSKDVWQTETPYLKSVESQGEELSPRYQSTAGFSINDFMSKIKEINPDADFSGAPSSWVGEYTHTEGGSVKTVVIGKTELKGTDIRSKFGLRSADFTIDISDKVVFNVIGNGHGVGMSQYGANYAAANGSSYEQILKKYYLNTELKKMY